MTRKSSLKTVSFCHVSPFTSIQLAYILCLKRAGKYLYQFGCFNNLTNVCLLGLKCYRVSSAICRKGYKANQWAKEAMVQAMAHSFIEQ